MWERDEVSFNIVGRLGKTGMCCNGRGAPNQDSVKA